LSGERVERRLTAILAADVAGYSRLMGLDEAGTLARLRAHRRELIDPKITEHRGRVVKTTGDGILIEFPSVVEAVACAVAVQRGMAERNVSIPEDQRIVFRVGVNLGDIIVEGDDIHGDGVNVAARLEGIAEPGGICVSGTVRDHIGDRLDVAFDDMGEQSLKNIARPLRVYRVLLANAERTPPASSIESGPALALPEAGNRVRITGQLIDALTGTHLWADRFDGSLEDVFDLQDKVAISVAGVIEPALQAAEMHRSAARPTTDLTAYDLYLRALAAFFPITKERIFAALGLLEQAIAIDRHYGLALSWAAMCHRQLVQDGWAEAPETNRSKGTDLAREALQVGENDPDILVNAALVLAYFGEDIGAMIGLVDRALALNPSFARGWNWSGILRLWAGQHDLAIEHVETSLRLSPRERVGVSLSLMGQAYFLKRRFDDAVPKLLLAIQDDPGHPPSYRYLAACYAHMGRLDDARAIVAKLLAITPLVPSALALRNPEDRELLVSGLRLAAGEAE
jgi:class 3 adenylate cyclase/tetratricopeptide (TPR) repeat protein